MSEVNGVNFNAKVRGIKSAKSKQEENKISQKAESSSNPPKTNFKSAEEILNSMEQMNQSVVQKKGKTLQISDYVNPEQAERIANSVKSCIKTLLAIEEAAIRELGIPQPLAQKVAVATFEEHYMPS